MRRLFVGIMVVAGMAGCGGDSTGPSPYPNVQGAWTLAGTFDGLTWAEAHFDATVAFTQPSTSKPPTGGTINITLWVNGAPSSGTNTLSSVTLTRAGAISFQLAGGGETWTWSGTVTGKAMDGTHILTDGVTSFTGPWSGSTP